MNTQKKFFNVFVIFFLVLSILSSLMLLTSCGSKNNATNKILTINNYFLNMEKTYLENNDAHLPKFDLNKSNPENILSLISNNASNAIKELNEVKSKFKLPFDESIWLDSFIFKWKNKINNINANVIYLGANPIENNGILSSSSNYIKDYLKSEINIYPISSKTGDPDITQEPLKDLVFNLANKILDAKNIIDEYRNIMNYGSLKYGYMPSTIAKKYLIYQLLTTFYMDQINEFANENIKSITITNLLNLKTKENYFSSLIKTISNLSYLNIQQKQEINQNLNELEKSLKKFVIWYCTSYYNNSSSFGPVVKNDLKLWKKLDIETKLNEKVIISSNGIKIYGTDITDKELSMNNVGIGFMKLKNGAKNPNELYQQLLFNNNSININAIDIYKKGLDLSLTSKSKMLDLATKVKNILKNNLTGKIWYDDDGIGIDPPREVELSGNDIFIKFNKWLNQEDFFWGREKFSQSNLAEYINKYWLNPNNLQIKAYKQIIQQQGYESKWENKATINGLSTGTVSGNQALAGAVASLEGYRNFKIATDSLFNKMFNKIKDYVLSPYDYSIREDIGVGMEGPRGSCQFQYNCDPYYSLPKWSISSLTVHEGKMGHHTQQEYWTEYLPGKGSTKNSIGYVFVNDAFHEGWAVFAEWYANELGIYGSNLDSITRMPNNWLLSKGLVPNYNENKINKLIDIMKLLHGGVYYSKVKGSGVEKLKNSIKLANMLQYYGFLNESQLRNMRLCIDVAYHHSKQIQNLFSYNSDLPFGASIQQVRNFMMKNSALSIGDIKSESIRYLVMPSQATGYMLGKLVFEELYKSVENKIKTDLSINDIKSKSFFNLVLKNGEIPLEVLQNKIKATYNISNYF